MSLTPVTSDNSNSANLNQINNAIRQLNNEAQTKVFKGPENVNAVINGKLPNDLGYGFQLSDSNGVPRIIAYIDANNNPIFKVSESGQDVTTATNDDLIFNSSQNVFKIVEANTQTLIPPTASWAAGNTATVTVPHGLGYEPVFLVYVDWPTSVSFSDPGLSQTPSFAFTGTDAQRPIIASARVDSTNLYLELTNQTGLTANLGELTWTYKYYILQETAT